MMLDQAYLDFSAAAAKALWMQIRIAIDAGEILDPGCGRRAPRHPDQRPRRRPAGHINRETFAIVCDNPEEFRKTAREMVEGGTPKSTRPATSLFRLPAPKRP